MMCNDNMNNDFIDDFSGMDYGMQDTPILDMGGVQSMEGYYTDPTVVYEGRFTDDGEYISPEEQADEVVRKNYNRYIRNRPSVDIPSLGSLLPEGAGSFPEFDPYYMVSEPFDQQLPKELKILENTVVQEYTETLKRPVYDIYFQVKDEVRVPVTQGSLPVFTKINVKLPYKTELPEGFEYVCRHIRENDPEYDGYVFLIPKDFLKELKVFSLVISRNKLKSAIEYYRVTLSVNQTVYLSIVKTTGKPSRYQGTSVTPIHSDFDNNFDSVLEYLTQYWLETGVIPDPSAFLLSTGECLSFTHTRQDDDSFDEE